MFPYFAKACLKVRKPREADEIRRWNARFPPVRLKTGAFFPREVSYCSVFFFSFCFASLCYWNLLRVSNFYTRIGEVPETTQWVQPFGKRKSTEANAALNERIFGADRCENISSTVNNILMDRRMCAVLYTYVYVKEWSDFLLLGILSAECLRKYTLRSNNGLFLCLNRYSRWGMLSVESNRSQRI